MSIKTVLAFNTEQNKTFNLTIPKSKRASALTKQIIGDNMDKILATNAVETPYGNLISKKKAAIVETTVINLI